MIKNLIITCEKLDLGEEISEQFIQKNQQFKTYTNNEFSKIISIQKPCVIVTKSLNLLESHIIHNINPALIVHVNQKSEIADIIQKLDNIYVQNNECVCSSFDLLHKGCSCNFKK